MKYKVLKSAAHKFGHSFASSLNWRGHDSVMSHLARSVVTSGEVELSVDLLSGQAKPTPLLEEPVQASVTDYVRWFPDLLRSQRVGARGSTSGNHVRAVSARAAGRVTRGDRRLDDPF